MIEIRIPYKENWNPRIRMFYMLIANSINPKTNLVEFQGKPMCSMDICAFVNASNRQIGVYLKAMINDGVILNVKGSNKDLYYVNPRWAKDNETSYEELDWLMQLFNLPENKHERIFVIESNKEDEIVLSRVIKPMMDGRKSKRKGERI